MHRAIYGQRRGFEYWGHEASWLPIEDFRYFLPRMKRMRERGRHWWHGGQGQAYPELSRAILDRITAEGPLTSAAFEDTGGHRGTWWDWKPAKRALEDLFDSGDLMSAGRTNGFARLYDLPERVLPSDVDTTEPGEEEAAKYLMLRAVRALGVTSGPEAADYFRLKTTEWRPALAALIHEQRLAAVTIEGLPGLSYAVPEALEQDFRMPRHRPTFLTPFDNLVWHRDRTQRLFDFHYRLEIYTPSPQRQFGYYVLPLLAGGSLGGRADLKHDRQAGVLRVRRLALEGANAGQAASALRDLANHISAGSIVIERADGLASRVEALL